MLMVLSGDTQFTVYIHNIKLENMTKLRCFNIFTRSQNLPLKGRFQHLVTAVVKNSLHLHPVLFSFLSYKINRLFHLSPVAFSYYFEGLVQKNLVILFTHIAYCFYVNPVFCPQNGDGFFLKTLQYFGEFSADMLGS